jgi:hypothetical protein
MKKKLALIRLLILTILQDNQVNAMPTRAARIFTPAAICIATTQMNTTQNINGRFREGALPASVDEVRYPELAKFLKQYKCPENIERSALSLHQSSLFLKGSEIDRIKNAERLKQILKKEKLDRVIVPDKCLLPSGTGNSLVVASKTISPCKTKIPKSTKKEIKKQISKLKNDRTINLNDIVLPCNNGSLGHNTVYTDDTYPKIAIFDTEDTTFDPGLSKNTEYDDLIGIKFEDVEAELDKWREIEAEKSDQIIEDQKWLRDFNIKFREWLDQSI